MESLATREGFGDCFLVFVFVFCFLQDWALLLLEELALMSLLGKGNSGRQMDMSTFPPGKSTSTGLVSEVETANLWK